MINKNNQRAASSISYVPQQIFLSDDTVAANIAGIDSKSINQEAVEHAAKVPIYEFVINELPHI